jgi:spore germination cell wall hydrolase CwlJ-like protein
MSAASFIRNAHRHLRCQFTFACEGKDLSKVDELDMWEQAKTISRDMLDGRYWLTEVGHATHYHVLGASGAGYMK